MTTAEDVFYLYERNLNYYYRDILENQDDMKFSSVLPYTIGDQDTPCDFKIRCYIRPGDECPICCDPILTKTSAFITDCGHYYHKKCLFKYIKTKWDSTKFTTVVRCPMCRCSLGHPNFIQRYRDSNQLDYLEDFWLSIDYKIPEYCCKGYNHYIGNNKTCINCKNYREKGEICI